MGSARGECEEIVGERPYEMVWANRTEDTHPALIDFENIQGWQIDLYNAQAKLILTREQTILPDNLTKDYKTSLFKKNKAFNFRYSGRDGVLEYRYQPKTRTKQSPRAPTNAHRFLPNILMG